MKAQEKSADYLVSSQATEWLRGTLGELLPIKYGKSLPEKLRDTTGSQPVFGSSGLVGTHSSTLTSGPTLIIGRKGNVGAIHYSSEACWPIDTVYYVEAPEGQNLRYYKYLLESLNLVKLDKSTAVPGLSRDDYNAVEVVVAPPDQQDSIVAEIEKQFSRLDEAVANLKRVKANLKRVKANLKRYKAAVLKAAVEGRLVETEAERARREGRSYEPGAQLLKRILETRRSQWQGKGKYKEPAEPDTTDLPELPEGWVYATIGQVAECLDSMRIPINKTERLTRSGEIPYYGANGRVGFIDDYIFDEPLVLVVEDETFTGRKLPFSYKISGKSWVNNHAHVLRPTDMVTLDYLNYALSFYPFTPLTTGTTGRKKLTQLALVTAPLGIPPQAEQQRIVAEVDRRLSLVRETEAQVDANLQRAVRLQQSILSKGFSEGFGDMADKGYKVVQVKQ